MIPQGSLSQFLLVLPILQSEIKYNQNSCINILSVLEEIRNNTKGGSSTNSGEEKSGGGMGLLGMLGALASGIKKVFSTSLKIGKGIYKGIRERYQ